jgi:hypothetical protein
MKKKIIILDFSVGEVHIFPYDENIWEDGEDFLEGHYSEEGQTFKGSQCQWMIVDIEKEGRLQLYIH